MTQEHDKPSGASGGSIASPFEKILLATIAMHELERQGKADSDEADAIRDTVDEPWRSITDSERETARAVSAALQRARQ
jgi:hypothetical protein